MNNNDFISGLTDEEIERLLSYTMPFSDENARNIRYKFFQKAQKKQRRLSYRALVTAAAVAVILLFSGLVYAGVINFGKIYGIVFGEKSGYVEQYITPYEHENLTAPAVTEPAASATDAPEAVVQETGNIFESECDGIVLKLISAINDENALRIFATATDTKGDRLGEKLDFSSWGLSQGYGGNISVVDYDAETKTATLLISSLGSDHNGSATLNVFGISTGTVIKSGLPENNINVYDILKSHTPGTMSQREVFVNGAQLQDGDGREWSKYTEGYRLLKRDETDIAFENLDWAFISNIGFVDGRLHIQKKQLSDIASESLALSFVNSNNEAVYAGYEQLAIYFMEHDSRSKDWYEEPFYIYKEFIYEGITDAEQLKDLSVTVDFVEDGKIIEGEWSLAFEIPEKVTTEFEIGHEIGINGEMLKIDKVSLSPLGVTIQLPKNISPEYEHTDRVYVEYDDGTTVELNQSRIAGYESESSLNFSGEIVEVEKARKIVINDEVIDVRP